MTTSGRLEGRITLQRKAGQWSSSGDAVINALDATGPRLAGDHLRLDHVTGIWDWDPARMIGSGSKNRLRIETPIGLFRARSPVSFSPEFSRMERGKTPRGSERAGLASGERASTPTATLVEGTLDLATLARQIPHALRIREGITLDRGTANLHTLVGSQAWEVEARLSDLSATGQGRSFTLRDPASLAVWLRRRDDVGLAVERLAVQTPFLDGSGQGNLKDGITWTGNLDLAGIERQLGELVDFRGVELAGKGEIKGAFRRLASGSDVDAHATARLRDLRVGGIHRDEIQFDGDVVLKEPAERLLAWDRLRVKLASGNTQAAIKADSRVGATDLEIIADAPTSRADPPRKVRGTLGAHWKGQALEIGQLVLAVSGGDKPDSTVLAARGRFDREAGTLDLDPVATDRRPGTMTLAPEGVHVSGIGKAGALRAKGALVGDLGVLQQLGLLEDSDWDGPWSARAEAQQTSDGLRLGGRFELADLSRPESTGAGRHTESPVVGSITALYQSEADRLELAELALSSRYVTLEASGSLTEPGGRRLVDLKGTLTPDWEAINDWLADQVEPDAKVAGKARAWSVRGSLAGGSTSEVLKAIDGDAGFDLTELDVYGMRVGPAPVVVRAREGRLGLDTIDTTLNEGRIHLEPTLSVGDREHGPSLRLGAESKVEDARINDEVSRRVLSFVAPVLENATRVRGLVSVEIDEAVLPIGGDARRDLKVDGEVVFRDVEFIAGPLGHELLGLIGRDDLRDLKLNQPVELTIADRKVYQQGLALPLGKLSRIELEGWVDFDRNLSLTASLPVTAAMVGNRPILSDIVEGTAVRVPIRGTLQKPEIDRDAMKLALKDLGQTLLERGAVQGAAEVLMRLTQPRDPNAPLFPNAAERRVRRLERQEQRRRERGMVP
jgi:translocation and assembly module TamB